MFFFLLYFVLHIHLVYCENNVDNNGLTLILGFDGFHTELFFYKSHEQSEACARFIGRGGGIGAKKIYLLGI